MKFSPSSPALRALLLALMLVTGIAADSRAGELLEVLAARGSDGSDISGQGQTVHVGSTALLRIDVRTEDGLPAAGVPIRFERTSKRLEELPGAITDAMGRAEVEFPVGQALGTQFVSARVNLEGSTAEPLLFRVHVRSTHWVLTMLLGLAGGLALFLLGMDGMSSSLRRAAGGRLRTILATFTRNRFVGVGAGALVTVLIQSSSATTVLLVSFVQAGILSFSRTLGVILGADIGTTATVQLISFKLTDIALPMIALGFILRFVVGRRRLHNTGEAVLGFGMLFYGLAVMADSMSPLRDYQPFVETLRSLDSPWLGILVGTALTAMIQSSAASIGIVIVLGQEGLLGFEQGIPLLFGANIGTCVTAVLASLRSSAGAQRVAAAHVAFKIGGVLLMVGWIPAFADVVRQFTGTTSGAPESVPRLLANAHTLFNVGLAAVFLPFTGTVARVFERAIPDRPAKGPRIVRARFLDPQVLKTPELALSLAKVEILDLGRRVHDMSKRILGALVESDIDALDAIHSEEKKVDALQRQIHDYLLKIGQQHIGRQQMSEVYLMLHVSVMFEHIADILDKELRRVARRRIQNGIQFSARGRAEIEAYHLKMVKQIARAREAFEDSSLETARRITEKQQKYDNLDIDYRRAHFERLRAAVSESVDSSEIHLDIMDGLQKITNQATNIARAMIAREAENSSDTTSPPA